MHGNTETRIITVQLSDNFGTDDNGLTPENVREAVEAVKIAADRVIAALLEDRREQKYNGICIARQVNLLVPDIGVTFRLDTDMEG